jgi:hypothetical protein
VGVASGQGPFASLNAGSMARHCTASLRGPLKCTGGLGMSGIQRNQFRLGGA